MESVCLKVSMRPLSGVRNAGDLVCMQCAEKWCSCRAKQWGLLPWWAGLLGSESPASLSTWSLQLDLPAVQVLVKIRANLPTVFEHNLNRDPQAELEEEESNGFFKPCSPDSSFFFSSFRHSDWQSKTSSEIMSTGTGAAKAERRSDSVQAHCVCYSHPCVMEEVLTRWMWLRKPVKIEINSLILTTTFNLSLKQQLIGFSHVTRMPACRKVFLWVCLATILITI